VSDTKRILGRLLQRQDLGGSQLERFIGDVMDGGVEPPQVAAVLVALRMKGETGREVAAAARAMRKRSLTVPVGDPRRSVDTCGTGGDGAETVNISTAAALVAAAAGVPVAKHGNRSVSSRCGSADVLEAAGVRLGLEPEGLARVHDELDITFLFAPRLHPAMAAVMPVRRSLGVRTIFNLLGPLTNPAGVARQVVGVWGAEVQPFMAEALAELGSEHALVVHSDDGLDELSIAAPSTVLEVRDGSLTREWRVEPEQLGVEAHDPASLRGGDVAHNVARIESILGGSERSAATEAVALNAAAAIYVGGEAPGLGQGLERAREVLHSGAALERLHDLARRTAELGTDG
jgi:anthranilate phosphoribosyltransferase